MKFDKISTLAFVLTALAAFGIVNPPFAQTNKKKPSEKEIQSIGGREHQSEILGVTVGMDVPTALQMVFVNANRQPGQEKPDAKKSEGKNGKDIRVVYKNLPQGDLQILFADGKYVREILLTYAKPPIADDLRLSYTSSLGGSTSLITSQTADPRGLSERTESLDGSVDIDAYNAKTTGNADRRRGEALDGERFDDRYTVAFADNLKQQRVWYRNEKNPQGFRVRVQFTSEKKTKAGANYTVKIAQKLVALNAEDEQQFRKYLKLDN